MSDDTAKIEELKKKYPSGLYEGAISFTDEDGEQQEVEFFYRKPTTADLEAHARSAQRNPLVANLNILQQVIVHPESGPVIAKVRDYPAAYGRFVDEAISPFFGGNVQVRNRKL